VRLAHRARPFSAVKSLEDLKRKTIRYIEFTPLHPPKDSLPGEGKI
jgi:uncharacterized protein (UPF0305 family)